MSQQTASAVSNTYSTPGTLMKENYPDVLDARFRDIQRISWAMPIQGLKYFKETNTDRSYEKRSAVTFGGLLSKARDVDNIPQMAPIQGFDVTLTPEEYKAGIRIGRRLRETDQFSVIDKHMMDLNDATRQTIELSAALVYNQAFGTSEALAGDGMYLVDASRPFPDNSVTGTWSNLETGSDLTQGSIEAMRLNFRKHLDESGQIAPIVLKKLVVPPDLQSTANVQLGTQKKSGTALNDESEINTYGIQSEVWDYLTDTNAFFGFGHSPSDRQFEIEWLWGVRPDFRGYVVADNPDVFGFRARMVFVTGFRGAHAVRGNAGSS